ncbi:MAG TPA: glycosyltransferase family 2 protein, partial [Ilumatobacteraceae bacterium]
MVVPCYNEEGTILALLKQVADSPWVREIIVVDDGSTDETRSILEGLHDPTLRVVLHPRNQGKGAALRTGFAHATSDYVIVQDADLEYDPQEFSDLLPPI